MPAMFRDAEELEMIAREVINFLRPKHLTVGQIRKILGFASNLLEYVTVREPQEKE